MVAENKYSKQKWKKRNNNTAKQTRRISATFDIGNCRMTNYELLRWLVETPSRDVEHYRMINASRSTGSHYNDARRCLCHTSQPIRHNKGVNLRAVTQWRHSLQRYQHATTMVNRANMSSSIKPEVYNISQRHHRKTDHGHAWHARKFSEDRTYNSGDMPVDRQTVATLCDPYRGHSNYLKSFKNKIS